jgi:hypothetical protein
MIIVPTVVVALLSRRWRDTLLLGLAAVPYLAWRAALGHTFAHPDLGATTWASDFGAPFAGMHQVLLSAAHTLEQHQLRSLLVHQGSVLAIMAIAMGTGVLAVWQLRCGGDKVVAGTFLAVAVVGIFGSGGVWGAYANAGRDFGLVFPMLVFSLATRRSYRLLVLGLCALSALLTLLLVYRDLALSPTLPYTLTR